MLVTPRRPPSGISDPLVAQVLALAAESRNAERIRRAPTESPIRLLIVDTERVVLLGLTTLFAVARNCQVIAEATTADQAIELSRRHTPEIVILDADLPRGSAMIATQRIVADNPGTRVITLASTADPQTIIAAIHTGIGGYVLKRTEPSRLVDAVEIVASGGLYFDDAVIAAVREWFRAGRPASDGLARLSHQERRILRLIAEGKTNRDIAGVLKLSEYTVKTYVSSALKKLGLASRAEAAAFIIRREPDSAK
jgi:DNA-binding NarL/FixJ family response regulator